MSAVPLMMACTSDLSGKVRGKAYPAAEHVQRCSTGVGWTPANALITCFDEIAPGPYGSLGDLVLKPSADATVNVTGPSGRAYRFALGNIQHMDGSPWDCCLRNIARSAIDKLRADTGLDVLVAFEHEFTFKGARERGGAYTLSGFLAEQPFGETLMGMLAEAKLVPDTFLREFGRDQYEVTIAPSVGLRAADEAVILREMVHAAAIEHGREISFSPITAVGGIGNGVHVHLSLLDAGGNPVSYDGSQRYGMSSVAGSFAAGILKYLPHFVALTAASEISYKRLIPNKWSAAFNNLGFRDREAAVRICPIPEGDEQARARKFNVEFRAADASASPYLVLALLVLAGARGIDEGLVTPVATEEGIENWSPQQMEAHGLKRLPATLFDALQLFEHSDVPSWLPKDFSKVYLAHKMHELSSVSEDGDEEKCSKYLDAY